MSTVTQIEISEWRERMRNQGVSGPGNVAFVCPACGTVQSIRTLLAAGMSREDVGRYIGFSCVGRRTGSGPSKRLTRKERVGKNARGCDWSLGGLFPLHEIEVVGSAAKEPSFRLASSEAALRLEQYHDANDVPAVRTWAEIEVDKPWTEMEAEANER